MSSLPPPIPVPTLAYATPGMTLDSGGPWRDGRRLRTTRTCTLPPNCVKCGQHATKFLTKAFYWHSPWLYLLILPGILVYAIVALVLRKQAYLTYGLCAQHNSTRLKKVGVTWLAFLIGIGALVGGIALANRAAGREWEDMGTLVVILSFVIMLAAAIYGAVGVPALRAKRIDDRYAWYNGAGDEFLQQFPLP
ncbi:MAG: hypothetical protein H7144_15610 [Burkholderiales bacterium]|nr:hypothetical protein [Phycisphaerae bacterium]